MPPELKANVEELIYIAIAYDDLCLDRQVEAFEASLQEHSGKALLYQLQQRFDGGENFPYFLR